MRSASWETGEERHQASLARRPCGFQASGGQKDGEASHIQAASDAHARLVSAIREMIEASHEDLKLHMKECMNGLPRPASKSRARPSQRRSYPQLGDEDTHQAQLWSMSSMSSMDMDREDTRRRRVAAEVSQDSSAEVVLEDSSASNRCCFRERVGQIVQSTWFEACFAFAILSNSILIGVEVEWQARSLTGNQADLPFFFNVTQYGYNALFLVELVLRLIHHGRDFFHSNDWTWNVIDALIVMCSVLEMSVSAFFAGEALQNMSNLRIIRALRIIRLVRTLRLPTIIRFVSPLRSLVSSIISTLKSLVWAALLLLMIMYVFANLFTQLSIDALASDEDAHPDLAAFWASLGMSTLTLFQCISGGTNWREAHKPLQHTSMLLGMVFFVYIIITYFAVLNVVTGLFVNSAIENASRDPELVMNNLLMNKQKYIENIKQGFRRLDADGSGNITLLELEEMLKDEQIQSYFAAIGLNCDDAWTLFKLIDVSHNNAIDIDEFVTGCLKLKGHAGALELELLRDQHKWIVRKLTRFMQHCEDSMRLMATARCSDSVGWADAATDNLQKLMRSLSE
eukprot:TRINITY_DN63856_c0_g1_i1.p1 TRINITY_DN63856_c0_g1~~TRINITY_DN63856_c0_g1_i1.p1  ORF type:complete len:570 (+),score=68.53 TRINITY_DN63856_c0_g1_i1:64-1773(+)